MKTNWNMYIHSGQINPFTIFKTDIEEMSLLGERDKTQRIQDLAIIGYAHFIHCKKQERFIEPGFHYPQNC